jgi:16S rRNA (guanine966-N2)-methyltransferase
MSRAVPKNTSRAAPNRLRIIGGRWRGIRIDFPPIEAIRPSPDRVRETLFNWLQHRITGARCLDLFAGSGALGIEALSRGAAHVTFVDREPRIARHLTGTLERLGAQDTQVVTADAIRYLQQPTRKFDVVFLDPPFVSDLLSRAFELLGSGWLSPAAFIYVECPAQDPLAALPSGWSVYRSKRAGQVGYHLLQALTASVEEA